VAAKKERRPEQAESQLEALIERRHTERLATEGEVREHEAWEESEKKQRIAQRTQNRDAWEDYWRRAADFHYGQARECLSRARRVAQMPVDGSAPHRGGIWTHSQPSPNGDGKHES
jgi:hypothetical protein